MGEEGPVIREEEGPVIGEEEGPVGEEEGPVMGEEEGPVMVEEGPVKVEERPVKVEEGPVMVKEEPVSLFIVVYSFTHRQVNIIQIETPEQYDMKRNMDDLKVVRFISPQVPPLIRWHVSPTTSSTDDFYLFPSCHVRPPLHSYQFNFKTGMFQINDSPLSYKSDGFVVNLGRFTYFMSGLNNDSDGVDFECYNPCKNNWQALTPFPTYPFKSRIVATAVLGDNILFNADLSAIWAYNVTIHEWFQVQVDDMRCYSIVGEAILVEETFYALTDRDVFHFDTVLALSIKMEGSGCDLVFKCSILSEISVPGFHPILDDYERVWFPTRNLFHLGQKNFCVVQTCVVEGFRGYLYIQLTYMELTGESTMTVTKERMHKLKIQDREKFEVVQCFFLPQCKSTALGEGTKLDFKMYPHEDTAVYVRKLPRDVTVKQVEEGLNVFGPILRNGIHVQKVNKSECFTIFDFESVVSKQRAMERECFAIVDFESAASKQCAIEAKTVCIGGCEAEIYVKEEDEEEEKTASL